jgi:hypothetical protein
MVKLTLKKNLTMTFNGRFSGNGTFLHIPESIMPGCRQFAVTPAMNEQTINISRLMI